jgi:predicted SAM-dependent methyltransferase
MNIYAKKATRTILHFMGYELHRIERINCKRQSESLADEKLYSQYSSESLSGKRFYNLGAGNFHHQYWNNIDYSTDWYSDSQQYPFINYNLTDLKELPLPSESAELFYTSHTIEHVPDEAVLNVFGDCYRVLKKAGGIRIMCPDAKLMYDTLRRNDLYFWDFRFEHEDFKEKAENATVYDFFVREVATERCVYSSLPNNQLKSDEIKELFLKYSYEEFLDILTKPCKFDSIKPGYHINWWDENKIISFLKRSGFTSVYKSRYQQSIFPPLRNAKYFDKTFNNISLYIDAIKD